jgi:uncharacterized protein YjiS (DUF1127 family)
MQQDNDFDFSRIDLRSISPQEWTAVRAKIFDRARRERNEAIRSAIAWIWRGFRHLLKWSALRAAWISHVRKQREPIAAAQLRGLSDQWLADMGLTRSEIEGRVRFRARRISRRFSLNYWNPRTTNDFGEK